MSKIDRLANAADRMGVWGPWRALRSRLPLQWLTILTYHRVHPCVHDYLFDCGVIDVAPAAFEQQMALIAAECTPVGLPALRAFLAGEQLPPNPVLVTFDDGYRDNYTTALPILRRHGIPAIFFVATDYIDARRLFWWDKLNYLLKTTPRPHLTLEYPVRLDFELPAQREEAIRSLLRLIKTQYRLDVPRLLDELTLASGLDWDEARERRLADDLLMTWDDLRSLQAAGMEVQCHTATHRPLHTLVTSELVADLALGRRQLQQQLGHAPDALALPVGSPIQGLPSVRRAIERAGFRFAFTNRTGVVPLGSANPLHLQRIAIDCDWSMAHYRAVVHLPLPARSA